MAGHNKWSKIKRGKAVDDAKKNQVFTKLIKQIMTAAREGGGDPEHNPSLRVAIAKAREASMPSDNIQRGIDKATGNLSGVKYEEITYEAYGLSGVALMIETMTDNKNRTVANVRHILSKNGGSLGESGCVAWMFNKKGIITIERSKQDEKIMELAIENEAEDILEFDEVIVIETESSKFNQILAEIEKLNVNILESNIGLIASNEVELDDDTREKTETLIEKLEEDDDIQNIYSNMK